MNCRSNFSRKRIRTFYKLNKIFSNGVERWFEKTFCPHHDGKHSTQWNSKMFCRMLLLPESIRNFSLDAYPTNGDRSFFVDFPHRRPLVVAYPFGTWKSIKRRVTSRSLRRSVVCTYYFCSINFSPLSLFLFSYDGLIVYS